MRFSLTARKGPTTLSENLILTHLERMGWATIYAGSTKLGPSRSNWHQALEELTTEQRTLLVEKIERFEAKLKGRITA